MLTRSCLSGATTLQKIATGEFPLDTERPSYYSVLPAEVRYNPNLTADEKLLFSEITCLCNTSGFCWASNSYFAELYNVTPQTISRWINHLSEQEYIKHEIRKDRGNIRIISILWTIPMNNPANTLCAQMFRVTNNTSIIHKTGREGVSHEGRSKEQTTIPAKRARGLVNMWNNTASTMGLPKIRKVSGKRKKALIAAVSAKPSVAYWRKVFSKIKSLPSLSDRKERGWFDLDWLIKNDNADRLLNGLLDWTVKDVPEKEKAVELDENLKAIAKEFHNTIVQGQKGPVDKSGQSIESYHLAISQAADWARRAGRKTPLNMLPATFVLSYAKYVAREYNWRDKIKPADVLVNSEIWKSWMLYLEQIRGVSFE